MPLQPPSTKAAVRPLHLPPNEARTCVERSLCAALCLHAARHIDNMAVLERLSLRFTGSARLRTVDGSTTGCVHAQDSLSWWTPRS